MPKVIYGEQERLGDRRDVRDVRAKIRGKSDTTPTEKAAENAHGAYTESDASNPKPEEER